MHVKDLFSVTVIQLTVISFLISLHLIDALPHSGLGSRDELRLVQTLFEGYNELIRPVNNMSEIVTVDVQLALHQIIHVDEKNQILKSNVWIRMLWYDYQLKWEPADYGGITVIRIEPEKVWKPDIVLFNNADGKYEVSFKPNVVIYENGKVLWIPPAIYKSSCTIDVEYFPFDQQVCEMKLGSWTFNDIQVILGYYEEQEKVDLQDYSPSGAWDLMACPGQLSSQIKDDYTNISTIVYNLTMRRKTLFYTVNLIIPCVLITFLSVCVFFLPSDGVQKMTLCISILLALVVFLVLVSKILPPTSKKVPLISKYLLFSFIINIITIIITVVIINWNFRSPRSHRMAPWVREVFINYLPRLILMKRPNHEDRIKQKAFIEPKDKEKVRDGSERSLLKNGLYHHDADQRSFQANKSGASIGFRDGGGMAGYGMGESLDDDSKVDDWTGDSIPLTRETYKAMAAIRFIANHLKNEDDYGEILDDWRYVAAVIDRLMLYIFLAITFGGTIGILINAPHIFEYVDQNAVIEKIKQSKDGMGFDPGHIP